MYPKAHAISSFLLVLFLGLFFAVDVATLVWWIIIGTFVGVFIDLDHLLVAYFKKEKRKYVLDGIKHPIKTFVNIKQFNKNIFFKGFRGFKVFSHLFFSLIISLFSIYFNFFVIPILSVLTLHISLDFYILIVNFNELKTKW